MSKLWLVRDERVRPGVRPGQYGTPARVSRVRGQGSRRSGRSGGTKSPTLTPRSATRAQRTYRSSFLTVVPSVVVSHGRTINRRFSWSHHRSSAGEDRAGRPPFLYYASANRGLRFALTTDPDSVRIARIPASRTRDFEASVTTGGRSCWKLLSTLLRERLRSRRGPGASARTTLAASTPAVCRSSASLGAFPRASGECSLPEPPTGTPDDYHVADDARRER